LWGTNSLSTYVIGDIQGCFSTLKELLHQISFSPKNDAIWIAGDLVNRGNDSLRSLRWAKALNQSTRMVLGNHEIHLLAVYFGIKKSRKSDTIKEIIEAPDADELIDWLRGKKLVHLADNKLLVHAGFSPNWDLDHVLKLGSRIESLIQGRLCEDFLRYCFDKSLPPIKSDWPELAIGLHILTHIRACKRDGTLNTDFSGGLDEIPPTFHPWYELAHATIKTKQVFFGHWAAHGFKITEPFFCLDSGCVWGRELTAFRLEDSKAFHAPSVESKWVIPNAPI
jgi:bis(5'-nucleosyl)-tetraphosphatase (symmetrical)